MHFDGKINFCFEKKNPTQNNGCFSFASSGYILYFTQDFSAHILQKHSFFFYSCFSDGLLSESGLVEI